MAKFLVAKDSVNKSKFEGIYRESLGEEEVSIGKVPNKISSFLVFHTSSKLHNRI